MAPPAKDSAPRLEGAAREGVLALAELTAQVAAYQFAVQSDEEAVTEIIEGFSDFLGGNGVVDRAALAKFWEGDSKSKKQLEAERRALVEHAARLLSERMAKLLLDVLGRTGGVALSAAAAARGRTLLRRIDENGPLYNDEETEKIFELFGGETLTTVSQLEDALAKVKPGPAPAPGAPLEKARREANIATSFFIACFATTWTLFIGNKEIGSALLGRYYRALCDQGLATEANLTKMLDDELGELRQVHELSFKAFGDVARRMGDYTGRVYLELAHASDGMLLTPRAARRAETLLTRMLSQEDIFTDAEERQLAAEYGEEMPGAKELEAAFDKILRAGAH
ncbi:MAG: hypothetical protein ISN26_07930 [Betaproteobacteria bacterium AqS2]|uniref:Uncharacterized protein n=1 Tax=Candidatus Amphirhobacter heronislandensis TaxID=1732024 RepID=A0A930UGJ0_9GAMM|nr:hypothetical protein [Betaproteobacteria bacterium AqS2]